MEIDPIRTEFLFTLRLEIGPRHVVGATPFGDRRIAHVTGGRFEGPKLAGHVLPGSGDWPLFSAEGAIRIDARITLETHDSAIVYMSYQGIRSGPPDVLERLNRGEDVEPSSYYFRIAPFFETGPGKYGWLNCILAVGSGRRSPGGVTYEVYQVL